MKRKMQEVTAIQKRDKIKYAEPPQIDLTRSDWEIVLDRFTKDMDPWNIDILKLADRYRSYIDRLKGFDFEIPARLVLVCSMLLRMKTEILGNRSAEFEGEDLGEFEEPEEFFEEDYESAINLHIPEIALPIRRKPKRTVTIEELKRALGSALLLSERRDLRAKERESENVGVAIKEKDIKARIDGLFSRLRRILGRKERVEFEDILESRSAMDKLEGFVNVLHLETKGRVNCIQKEFLGKILIELNRIRKGKKKDRVTNCKKKGRRKGERGRRKAERGDLNG